MIRSGPAIALPLLLMACTEPEHRIVRAYNTNPDTAVSQDERLQLAAFEKLKGMTRDAALTFLESDGFTCVDSTCLFSSENKLSAAEAAFGISFPRNKVFGERQASKSFYQIKLNSDVIDGTGDITADARFESGRVPWHRRPRPSDYEVTHD